MPVSKRTTQQKITPTKKPNAAVSLDNELQLDSKINQLFSISQNISSTTSDLKLRGNQTNKYLLFTDNEFVVENFSESCVLQVVQGSNYPVIRPKNSTIIVANSTTPLIFENVEFYSTSKDPIISIQSNSKVLMKNCVFRKPTNTHPSAGISSYVDVGATSNVSFVGCWFLGQQSFGSAINNAGVPAAVSINGGFNTTGVGHLNTTGFGEQS